MILGPMIAVAMASALALPATSVVASKASAAQTPPPAASTNPLVSLAGAGFALHLLWWVAIAALIVWALSFLLRR